MLTRARAVVVVLAGLTLAACSNVHPGAAAVVDGESISMKTVDQTAKVYCVDTARQAKAQGATLPSNADMRRQAVVTLAALKVARKLARDADVTPSPSMYEVPDSSRDKVAKEYKGIDIDVAVKALEVNQELRQIAASLGEKAAGQKQTAANLDQLQQAGYAEISTALPKHHLKFAPLFGLNSKIKNVAATGSLSVQPTDLGADEPDDLPKAQRCS